MIPNLKFILKLFCNILFLEVRERERRKRKDNKEIFKGIHCKETIFWSNRNKMFKMLNSLLLF